MHGVRSKDVEALWRHNKNLRKKALSNKLSPQEFQSLPPQLRLPIKLHGFGRPKGLRGPALVQWVMLLGGICRDKRFDDFLNALFEHGIVDSRIYEIDDPRTHQFLPNWQEVDRDNEYQQTRCLEEVRARMKQGKSKRQACREVAAEWALGNSLEAGWKGLSDQLRPPKK
jgi:hypothetical protein